MYFDHAGLTAGTGEVAVSNVKRLLLDLEAYYAEGLGLGTERLAELDAEALAGGKSPGQVSVDRTAVEAPQNAVAVQSARRTCAALSRH